jgi:hypothetical protein
MIIATFGPTTAWLGRSIAREGHVFVLEGHGPVSAEDVMEYDRQGHLAWATDGTRAWVETMAAASRASQAAPPTITSAASATSGVPGVPGVPGASGTPGVSGAPTPSPRPTPGVTVYAQPRSTGLEGVSRGDWVVVGGSLAVFFGMLLARAAGIYTFAGGWLPMLAAIAAVVVVVLTSGVIPEQRYEMGGRAPLILMGLGAVAFLLVLIGMIVETSGGWEAGSSVALLGAAAVLGGGFLNTRDAMAAVPVTAAVFAGNAMPSAAVAVTPPRTSVQTPGSAPGSAGPQATNVEPRIPVEPPIPLEPPAPGPASAAAPTDPPARSVANEIATLADLRAKGMLTDDEFAAFKAKLMERPC